MHMTRLIKITKVTATAITAMTLINTGVFSSHALDSLPNTTLSQAVTYQGDDFSPKTMRVKASTCIEDDFCVFVGTSSNLYLELAFGDPKDFASMKQVRFSQLGEFSDVTCLSKTWCSVVGTTYSDPFVISGDPNSFSDESLINLKLSNKTYRLTSITCVTQNSCLAAGDSDAGDAIYFYGNPAIWTAAKNIAVAPASSFGLARQYVRCLSANYCVLAGQVQKNMTINSVFWSGSLSTFATGKTAAVATKTQTKTATNIYGLWCFQVDSCLVQAGIGVFDDRSVILKGSPKRWKVLEIVGGQSALGGMDCLSLTRCSASVGIGIAGVPRSYVYNLSDPETWAETRPSEITNSVNPRVSSSVECSLSNCYLFTLGSDNNYKMFTGNNGSFAGMKAQFSTENYGFQNQITINSMKCVTDAKCIVVGSVFKNGAYLSMSSVFDPQSWAIAQLKVFSEDYDFDSEVTPPLSALRSVSCLDESFCVAVGNSASLQPSFAVGDPGSWKLKTLSGLTVKVSLGYVSCVAKDYCTAIGAAGENEARDTRIIIFTGNPTTWATAKPKIVDFGDVIEPSGLSCLTKTQCVMTFTSMLDQRSGKYYIGNPANISAKSISKVMTYSNQNVIKCFSKTNCIAAGSSLGLPAAKKGAPREQVGPAIYVGDPATWAFRSVTVIQNSNAAKVDSRVRGTYQYSSDIHAFIKPSGFVSVDCLSALECYAVGFDSSGSAVVSRINSTIPGNVNAVAQALPQGWKYANYDAVSCASTQCFAMGSSDTGAFLVRLTQPVQ